MRLEKQPVRTDFVNRKQLLVRDWLCQAHETLERVTGLDIRATDFADDRLVRTT